MMKIVVLLVVSVFSLYAKEYKVVFDVRSGVADVIENSVLGNIEAIQAHYAKTGDSLKAVVVLSGGSYGFFKKTTKDPSLAEDIAKVAKIEVCSMGMKKRKITSNDMLPFVIPAFNRTEALIRYANEGYAYILVK